MILEFSVKNFKSIKEETTLSFEATADNTDENVHVITIDKYRILKLGVIYGANASGKTNLLLALDFLRDFVVTSSTDLKPNESIGYTPFLFDEAMGNQAGCLKLTFFISEIKYDYEIILDNSLVHEEKLYYTPKGQKTRIFESKFDFQERKYTVTWNPNLKKLERFSINLRKNASLISSIVQLIEQPELKKVYDWFDKQLSPIITPSTEGLLPFSSHLLEQHPELKEFFLSVLSTSDFGNIDDIWIDKKKVDKNFFNFLPDDLLTKIQNEKGEFELRQIFLSHKYKNGEGKLLLSEESRGTQRFFELAGPLALISQKNTFLCIDELDTSVHPTLQEHFLTEFLNMSTHSQLLITTHNVQLLDSGLFRRDEIWFANKNMKTGSSEYYSLAEIKGTRKAGSYRKQYLAGKYGAIPVVQRMDTLQ